jgi:hypothetical protein
VLSKGPQATKVAPVVILALLLAGCAGGRDFVRPQGDSLRPGTTTYQEVLKKFGEPLRVGTSIHNGATLKKLSYSNLVDRPYVEPVPERALRFYFLDNVLVGYEYSSSFPEDTTDFDETSVGQIRKGETSRERVLELFGKPGGECIYPMISPRDANALVYSFSGLTRRLFVPGSVRNTRKLLIVSIGPNGIVSDVFFMESNPGWEP